MSTLKDIDLDLGQGLNLEPDLDLSKKKYHVVFLIDTNLLTCNDCNHRDEILLIVYRLLSAVKENSQRKRINVDLPLHMDSNLSMKKQISAKENESPDVFFKWGYKLFCSVETLSRSKNDHGSFQNLNQSQLNIFETKMCGIPHHKSSCDKNTVKRRSFSHPSQLFATALTETLHDFNWSYNDDIFSSPVTRKKHNYNSSHYNQSHVWCNLVFLISRAPHTDQSMRQFSNKKVVDSEIFVDSFMTPALLKEYLDHFKISINWIDMSSVTCSRLAGIDYSENCRKILHETCSKLGGKFMAKNSIIGCIPLLPMDKKPIGQYGKIVKPNFGLNWIPTESHTLDIFSGDAGDSSNSHHLTSYSAVVSILCFGLQNVPVTLIPMKKISVSREMCWQEQPSRKCLASEEISGASLTLFGLVQHSSAHDKLIHHSSQSFMLDIRDCEAMTQFLQTLEASNTLALLSVTPRSRTPKVVAILQSQQSVCNLTFLNFKTVNEFQIQAHHIICSEKKEKESSYLHDTKHPKPARDYIPYQIYQSHCMNYWHIPGSTNQMSHIIASLQDRINKDMFSSRNEKDGLKRLKQFYAKERQPKELIQNDQPVVNTPLCAIKKSHQSTSEGSEKNPKASLGRLKRTPSSILQRGRLMVDKARSASLLASEDISDSSISKPDCKTPEKHSSSSVGFSELGLKSKDDLLNYLKNQYEQILKAHFATEIAVRAMITVTSQFMARLEFSNPQRAAANFIQDHLSLEPVQLKEKYQTMPNVNDDTVKKTAEYKLQVLLIMETESLLRDNSDHSQIQTEKVVALLRGLSFSSGAPDLKSFLTDIVASYSTTMPKLIVDIYDELMIPLPLMLKKFASPGPSSVYNGSFEQDASFSSAPSSSQPSSVLSDGASQHTKRSSKFKQHPSFADYRQKKQILVEPVPKQDSKGKVNKAEREKSKTRLPTSVKKYQGECDKAKRNLFSEHRPKAKTSKRRDRQSKTQRKRRHTMSTTDKAQTLVLGTPIHKQKRGWHIQQQERRRLRDNVQPEVQTVAESPLKENDLENVARIDKPARYIVREAFYSSNSQQSRNFAKALEQSQKTDGFPISEISYEKYPSMNRRTHGTLASAVRGESPALSPRTRLFKTLMPSPSPAQKSQRREQTSQVTTPGRPSKRLAKRLDFSNMGACSSKKSIQPLTLDAQLIFDGENANDFNVMKSPSKKLATTNFRECFKTPEKQIKPSRPDMWSSASCPPPSLSSPSEKVSNEELNFRNTLFRNAKSSQGSPRYQLHRSPHSQKKYTDKKLKEQSPLQLSKECSLSSPEQASRIRSNLFSKSPKKVHLFAHVLEKDRVCENVSVNNISPMKVRKRSENKTPIKKGEDSKDTFAQSNSDIETNAHLTTPKKSCPSETNSSHCAQSTPSKVKFSEQFLISPPTGSGYPPSAEKSTPGKSILKGSPSMKKVKIPRRIQLQPIESMAARGDGQLRSNLEVDVYESNEIESLENFVDNKGNLTYSVSSKQLSVDHKEREDSLRIETVGLNDVQKTFLLAETKSLAAKISQSKASKDEIDSIEINEIPRTSVHLSSEDECGLPRYRPATIQIRTPSPRAKKSNSIQSWARRKKCSPKHNANLSSNLIVSPTSSSSSSEGKSKATLTKMVTKENEISDTDPSAITSKGKQGGRKRGLFQVDENEFENTLNKRQRKNSNRSQEYHSSYFITQTIDGEGPDKQSRAHSPELFETDVDDWSMNNTSCPNSLTGSQTQRLWSPSSQKRHLAVYNKSSPIKRLTRQSSTLLEEGSLGFPNPLSPTAIFHQTQNSNKLSDETPGHSKHTDTLTVSDRTPNKSESSKHTSKTLRKKQYSPSLSTHGLVSLIKSPFVAAQSDSPDIEVRNRSSDIKSKTRKHLNLS